METRSFLKSMSILTAGAMLDPKMIMQVGGEKGLPKYWV